MNLYHLRYFSTLAHIEHYTKAADILAITQPSLSYAISTLEEELGVKLFEKNGRNVTLTKYGKVFLNDVEEVLNRLDSSVNSLKLAGKGEGCIDVVFLRTLGIDFLPKIMRGFLEENPTKKIDFNLYCDKVLTSDILNGLKEKKYDLGFCSKLDNEPLIEFIPVARQELVVIVPLDHPLAVKDEVRLEDTIPYKQIIFKKRSGLRLSARVKASSAPSACRLRGSGIPSSSTQGVSATVMPWAMTVRRPSAAFSIFNPRPAASSAGIAATLFSGCKVAGSSNPMRGSARVTLSNSCARAVISVCSSSRV